MGRDPEQRSEIDIYWDALLRIASAESGIWGTIANEALRAGAAAARLDDSPPKESATRRRGER